MCRCPIGLLITGDDSDTLVSLADRLCDELRKSALLADVTPDYRMRGAETALVVDAGKLAAGANLEDVQGALQMLKNGTRAAQMPGAQIGPYQLQLRDGKPETIQVKGGNGRMVPLNRVVEERKVPATPIVRCYRGRRAVLITAELAKGADLSSAELACREAVDTVWASRIPPGYSAQLYTEDPLAAPDTLAESR
jgi:multidrug efflux pump subunit AcrB